MSNKKLFRIGFGVLLPSIAKQLKEQGLRFDVKEVKHFEKLRESIIYLQFSDLINDSTREKIVKKLFDKIKQHVIKMNNQ